MIEYTITGIIYPEVVHLKKTSFIIAAILALSLTFVSCGGGGKITPNGTGTPNQPVNNTVSDSTVQTDVQGNETVTESTKYTAPANATPIRSILELQKIGKNEKFPLDGDYYLTCDIDLSQASSFAPIGGVESESGIVEGDNVFSGTFDGQGHVISGLSLSITSTARVHVGFFGSVGSTDPDDPAVIKNIIFKDVKIKGNARGTATYAVLCGQCSGAVTIDNVSIISGIVDVKLDGGDILGIASLIGQCRTNTDTGCSNKTINISNIFTNVEVNGENGGKSNYTSGLIGRIRGSDLGSLKNVLQIGSVNHEGTVNGGYAITTGDSGVRNIENVYYLEGCGLEKEGIGEAKSYESLSGGGVDFDAETWHVEEGLYPLPADTYNSPVFSVLDFVGVKLADGEKADKVMTSFELSTAVMGKNISWNSSDTSVISIENGVANVIKPEYGTKSVTLSARCEGIKKTFDLIVASGVEGELIREGDVLKAVNYPEGTDFKWIITSGATGKTTNTYMSKDNTYTLTDADLNCTIMARVEGFDDVSYYNSSLPTIYINSKTRYTDISKGGYSSATMSIATTSQYADTAYDGDILIKLRGNSTAYASKRPFKIKLDTKTELFGMEKNKHWCLLANHYDRTNLRNKISYDFGADLGLASCDSVMVNLVFNGEYVGLYEFTEQIRIDKGRVDIFNWEDEVGKVAKAIAEGCGLTDQEADKLEEKLTKELSWITTGKYDKYVISDYYDTSSWDISGGYLIEDDAYYDELTKFMTENDMKLMLHNPEYLKTNDDMMNWLKTYIQNLEDAIYAPNRLSSEGLHYSDYMDVQSFIDFWIVNTLYKNVELLFKSCYMYKDVGEKLKWGPIWDMDWTSANHVNLDSTSADYSQWRQGQSNDREYWYKALYNDPWFIIQLCERWAEVQDKVDNMFVAYDKLAADIKGNAEADNKLWGYDWSYDREVSTLREWLVNRRSWMNEQMTDPQTMLDSLDWYGVSKKFKIAYTDTSSDNVKLVLTISDDRIVTGDILVNGTVAFTDVPLTDSCTVEVPKSLFRESGLWNSIEILSKDSSGNYLAIQKRSGENGSNQNLAVCRYVLSD